MRVLWVNKFTSEIFPYLPFKDAATPGNPAGICLYVYASTCFSIFTEPGADNEVNLCDSPNGTAALLRLQPWQHTGPLHSHDDSGYHSRLAAVRGNHPQTVADECCGDGDTVPDVVPEKQPSAITDSSLHASTTRPTGFVCSLVPCSGLFSTCFLAAFTNKRRSCVPAGASYVFL